MKLDTNQPRVTIAAVDIAHADLIRSVLEANGIKSYLQDEDLGTWAPHIASPGGVGAVKVAVAESDVSRAKAIVAQMSPAKSDAQRE